MGYEDEAYRQFDDWRNMDASEVDHKPTARTEWYDDRVIRHPQPKQVFVVDPEGNTVVRDMTEKEKEAWLDTLLPELDEIEETGA